MNFVPAQLRPRRGYILLRSALRREAGDFDVPLFLHPVIFTGTASPFPVVLYGDDADIPLCARRIVDDHHPVGPVNADAVNADTAGQHQAVVGIELAELAVTDGHIHHDAAAHGVIKRLPE